MEKYEIVKLLGSGRRSFEFVHPIVPSFTHTHLSPAQVMQYCEGGDLLQRLVAQKTTLFPEKTILEYLVQLLFALEYIHSRHVLHRDIKTQNIFLSRNVVKLGDFGISKVLEGSIDLARTVIGTPYYMSPELLRNKPYGYKSDVWSAGCVLYEMMCLKHAFEGRDYVGLVNNIIKGVFPPVPQCYSPALKDLLAAMLNKSPEQRPAVRDLLRFPLIKEFMVEQSKAHQIERPLSLPTSGSAPAATAGPQPQPVSGSTPRASGLLRQRIEEKKAEAAISPARLRLMRELEVTRRAKEDLASRLEQVRQKEEQVQAPSTPGPASANPVKKRGVGGSDAPAAQPQGEEKKPPHSSRKEKKDAAPAPATPKDPKDRPQSAAEERKQLLERRWRDFYERPEGAPATPAAKEKDQPPQPRREHDKDLRKLHSQPEVIGDAETLEAELEKVAKDEKQIEETIESLLIEDKEKEGIQDFNLVMDSYAAHADAPPCPAGDLEDDDTVEDKDEHPASPSQEDTPVQKAAAIMPRLPGPLVDRVRVLRQYCSNGLGDQLFVKAYAYIRGNQDAIEEDDKGLLAILGPQYACFSRALLSLAFTESSVNS